MMPKIEELRVFLDAVAAGGLINKELWPAFERIDRDLKDAEALQAKDPVAALRAKMERSTKGRAAA